MDHSNLTAVTLNCTLKKDPAQSHTGVLLSVSESIMRQQGVGVTAIHVLSHDIAFGVQPDMTEHGWSKDDWPALWQKVAAADILIVGTPLWLGEESSVCRVIIERLYAMSGLLNDKGQSVFYGKVGGAVVTGNEDGVKHAAMTVLYALQHVGYSIPPQADCGWIGEAGPGKSYGDPSDHGPVGYANDFTQHNTTIMTWNLMHLAHLLKSTGGLPREGNDREAWKNGERFGYSDPDRSL